MAYIDELLKETKQEKPREKEEEKAVKKVEKIVEKKLIDSYGSVKIFKVKNEPLLTYEVPVVKPKGPEKEIITLIKEAATRLITISPEEIRNPEMRKKIYFSRVKEIIQESPELGVPKTKIDFYADIVVKEMIGYGLLDDLTKDDLLEEIMVIGPEKPVYVFHRKYDMMKTNIQFATDDEIKNIIDRIAMQVNRRVDSQNPLLDARLPDGSRVNATIKPISLGGSTITIRKFREDPFNVIDLIKYNTLDSEVAAFLSLAVDGLGAKPANILISGGTGSGKTTTLNVLASFIPERERVITIEDTAELKLPIQHWIRFETRPPGLEGTGEVSMDALVKNSLRMRPDRIIVGEIRSAEAFTMFTAMNTGHDGSLGTVHSNSAEETLIRLMSPPMSVPPVMINALDLIIVQKRIHDRRKGTIRRITEIAEVTGVLGEKPEIQVIYQWNPVLDEIKPTNVPSKYKQELLNFTGLSMDDLNKEIEDRKQFFEKLVKKNVTGMNAFIKELKKYRMSRNAKV